MSCEEYRAAVMEVALGVAAAPPLEAHLRVCATCRAALDDDHRLLGRIDSVVEATLQVAPSTSFLPRVRERVEEPGPTPGRWRWWLVPAAAAAAVGLLAFWRTSPAPIAEAPAAVAVEVKPQGAEAPPATVIVAAAPVPARRPPRLTPAPPEILVPLGEREALARYMEDLRRRQLALTASPGLAPAAADPPPSTDMPPASLAPLPTQTAVAPIDRVPAPGEIEMGPIRIALIGVQPLTMESWNEE